MTTLTLTRPRPPRAAFGNIALNEARLAWRQPAGMIVGAGVSLLLLSIFAKIPVFNQKSANLGGYTAFDIYIPILMCFSIAIIAFTYLPGPLVSYRELGILRRLSTTPVPAYWLLAAQVVVQACLMAVTEALIITVSIVFFGVSAPKNPDAMVLALALTMAALFAMGLAITAAARTTGAARGLMAGALYPMMFFSGLYYPMQLMPTAIQDISRFSPLGPSPTLPLRRAITCPELRPLARSRPARSPKPRPLNPHISQHRAPGRAAPGLCARKSRAGPGAATSTLPGSPVPLQNVIAPCLTWGLTRSPCGSPRPSSPASAAARGGGSPGWSSAGRAGSDTSTCV
jgi:ABC-2 type transport system permease protein